MNAPADRSALCFTIAWKAAAAFAALVFLMFADVLLAPGSFVLGNRGTDMFMQIYSWREFGFGELAKGNVALWNPHIYGGAPYFGGMQGALFYPTNVLLLFLPLPLAINWSLALNVWLMGLTMYAWAGYRGLKPLACFVAGVILMFCGPHFLHVYSGHPVHMATMAWAPLIFLAVDGLFESRGRLRNALKWTLLGMLAVAMQILAGHPQYLFYTAVAAGFYTLWGMARQALEAKGEAHGLPRLLAVPGVGLAAIFAGGALLAAAQLLPAFETNAETVRSIPVPFEFAAMFGFPPENLLTLLNPYFFGDMQGQVYWGRCYLWEMSLFIGASGLVLAVYGALNGGVFARSPFFRPARLVGLVVITFIFALGVHTPLFRLLYDYVPVFGKFRGISKFTFQTALFLGMLSATGLDALLRAGRPSRRFVLGTAIAGGVVLAASGIIALMGGADWLPVLKAVAATRESYLSPEAFGSLAFADQARAYAAGALFIPAMVLLATAALLAYTPRSRFALPGLVTLLTVELFVFAFYTRETFDTKTITPAALGDFYKQHPGDYRSLNLLNQNAAMSFGAADLWGADPGVERRYAEFMTWSQGGNPDKATQYVNVARFDPLYAMLRFRYAFVPTARGVQVAEAPAAPMDHVQLVSKWRIVKGRDAIFSALREPGFDPRAEVILETEPGIAPASGAAPGTARITGSSSDWLEVEADATAPSLLLITDAYSPGWRARALPGSSQQSYQVLPANYTLQAVPLAAGHHRLRIEYAPKSWQNGKAVTLVACLAFLGAAAWLWRSRRKPEGRE